MTYDMYRPLSMTQTQATGGLFALHLTPNRSAPAASGPTQEAIARRAYDLYLRSNRQPGHCQENWYRAEQSLRNEAYATRAASRRMPGAFVAHSTGAR